MQKKKVIEPWERNKVFKKPLNDFKYKENV